MITGRGVTSNRPKDGIVRPEGGTRRPPGQAYPRVAMLTGALLLAPMAHAAIDTYGKSERNKYRAVFYYLLVKHFGKESVYK